MIQADIGQERGFILAYLLDMIRLTNELDTGIIEPRSLRFIFAVRSTLLLVVAVSAASAFQMLLDMEA